VQHPFIDEMETIIKRNNIRGEIAHDGNKVMSMSEFVNIMNVKDKNDHYGKDMVSKFLKDDSPHKAYLESLGIYKMRNTHGRATPAMTFLGLKGLLSKLNCEVTDKYTNYCTETTTRVEAGDSNMKRVIDANATSSNVYNVMARDAVAQERASAGASIAAPPEQVLAVRRVYSCACVTLFDHGPTLQAPVAEDCTAVALRLPGVWIVSEEQAQIFLETKKIEAEKMESEENKAERAHVMQKKNLEHGLQMMIKQQDVLDRESKRAQKDLDKEAARERQKLQIEKAHELAMMEKQWDLQNRDATAMNAPSMPAAKRRKSKPATESNAPLVPLAIYKRSNTTTPLTAQQKLYKSNKAKQERLDAKAYRASLVSD
jgi:hypothetical protein